MGKILKAKVKGRMGQAACRQPWPMPGSLPEYMAHSCPFKRSLQSSKTIAASNWTAPELLIMKIICHFVKSIINKYNYRSNWGKRMEVLKKVQGGSGSFRGWSQHPRSSVSFCFLLPALPLGSSFCYFWGHLLKNLFFLIQIKVHIMPLCVCTTQCLELLKVCIYEKDSSQGGVG